MVVDTSKPRFYGGRPCLDFANTLEPRGSQPERDHLPGYGEVVNWARTAGIIEADLADALLDAAVADPAAATRAWDTAITLREAIYRVFAAMAEGRTPAPVDVATIHETHLGGLHHADLRAGSNALSWEYVYRPEPHPHRPLWSVAASAVDLLTSADLGRVKVCPQICGWLFLDTTKNRQRRWCSMQECGVGEKVRRQAERRQSRRS